MISRSTRLMSAQMCGATRMVLCGRAKAGEERSHGIQHGKRAGVGEGVEGVVAARYLQVHGVVPSKLAGKEPGALSPLDMVLGK